VLLRDLMLGLMFSPPDQVPCSFKLIVSKVLMSC
jgi:hypothetical protein